jgi:hypothetical protein
MTSGMPSNKTIMRHDEGSLSNPKRAKVKDNVFMTPIMSHQVRQFIQGVIVLAHMWEEKGSCVPSTQEKIGRISFSFPSFVVVLKA